MLTDANYTSQGEYFDGSACCQGFRSTRCHLICVLHTVRVARMIRLMTILILMLAGIPRVGVGMIGGPVGAGCSDMVCQQVMDESSCCEESAPVLDMDEFCPMSGGPCRCGITPGDNRNPSPKAPLQRSETQITLGLFAEPRQLCIWTVARDEHPAPMIGLVGNLHALRTHSETQAILGIWRT